MTAARCPNCDREGCRMGWIRSKILDDKQRMDIIGEWMASCNAHAGEWMASCNAHAVDWRARALAAEARIATVTATIEHDIAIRRDHQAARATGGQTCGTGGALTAAQPSMLAYLERAVRDLHDERTRSVAADAARWQRVAPLIDELRRVSINDGDDPQELEALRNELIATADRAAPEGETP